MLLDPDLLNVLNALYAEIPCSLSGGGRTIARNLLVGGAPRSKHLDGRAADLVFDTVADLLKGARWALDHEVPGIEVDERDLHLHLDSGPRIWRVWVDGQGAEHPLEMILAQKETPSHV